MPISREELIQQFGHAAELGNGALFIGAGLSAGMGLPEWFDLIEEPRVKAGVPKEVQDAPLMAQYIADSDAVGRSQLNHHVLTKIASGHPWQGNRNHQLINQLNLKEIWTTNYDRFLETVLLQSWARVEKPNLKTLVVLAPGCLSCLEYPADDHRVWVRVPVGKHRALAFP